MKPRSAPVLSTGDGFTLIELLIVLGIIVVLIGFAVPEWRGQIIAKQVDTASSNLLHHLTLARNVSIQTGLSVLVCPASRTLACELDASWSGAGSGSSTRIRIVGMTPKRGLSLRRLRPLTWTFIGEHRTGYAFDHRATHGQTVISDFVASQTGVHEP